MPRKSKISDKEFAKEVAYAFLEGMKRNEMAKHFQVHTDTITDWVNDPRVQVHISSGTKARENRIKRVIDKEIEARLTGAKLKDVPLELLLKLRKELTARGGKADDDDNAVSSDVWDALDRNPELADQIAGAIK